MAREIVRTDAGVASDAASVAGAVEVTAAAVAEEKERTRRRARKDDIFRVCEGGV